MANQFDKKGGFADMAAVRRKRNKTTPEKSTNWLIGVPSKSC